MEESVYSSITRDKDKTFKVRDLWVEESVYSNITRDKDKTFKVRDLWVEESVYRTYLGLET